MSLRSYLRDTVFESEPRNCSAGKGSIAWRLTCFVLVILLASACVTNKKVQYLQKDDVNGKDIPKDTVLRTYHMTLDDYRIQPMDLISIRVESATADEFDFTAKLNPGGQQQNTQNPLLNGFLIDNKGEVEYPVIGKIHLAGLSVFEAQDALKNAMSKYLQDPVVRVRLLNFRFTILGEVNGEKQVISTNTRVTFMEAIGLGGGMGELADRSNVKIVRQVGNTSEIFYLNLLEEQMISDKHYYVQQNDIIIVPPLKQRPFQRYFRQNALMVITAVTTILLIQNIVNK